jgi:putative glutamine amidotransferase
MHHQGIKSLASSLIASATAPDGLIEAAELPNGTFVVGVQWHPEVFELAEPSTGQLFADFVEAAGSR